MSDIKAAIDFEQALARHIGSHVGPEARRQIARELLARAFDLLAEPTGAMLKASSRGDARRARFYWVRMLAARRREILGGEG